MLSQELIGNGDYGAFEAAVMGVVNEHARVKKKSVRPNDAPFMTIIYRTEQPTRQQAQVTLKTDLHNYIKTRRNQQDF